MVESNQKVLRVMVTFTDGDKAEDLVEELHVDASTASFLIWYLFGKLKKKKNDSLVDKMGQLSLGKKYELDLRPLSPSVLNMFGAIANYLRLSSTKEAE